MSLAIATYNLTREYSAGGGIRQVSFQAQPGEVVGIIGPPFSGKSTLLKVLSTRIPASQGVFAILGQRVPAGRAPAQAVAAVRRSVGSLLEEAPVIGDLTGWENAWLLGRLHRISRQDLRDRLGILFDWAGMTAQARRPARTYTYPMRRKLGLIGAMLHDPRVLLLDEPFHGLDLESRGALQAALLHVRDRGAAVLMALGDPGEAVGLCSRILLMDGGRILTEGPAAALLRSLGTWSAVEVRLGGVLGKLDLSDVPGLCAPPEVGAGGLRVRVADPEAALGPLLTALARAGARVSALEVKRPFAGRMR